MHDCEKLREDIWEAVEVGETPDSLLTRLGDCETCRQELARAQSAMAGFQAMRAADAPDCADAVMTRIGDAHKGRAVWTWAFGLAIVLVIMVMLADLRRSRVAAPVSNVATTKPHSTTAPFTPQSNETAKDYERPGPNNAPCEEDRTVSDARERRGHRTERALQHSIRRDQTDLHALTPIRAFGDTSSKVAAAGNRSGRQEPAVVTTNPSEQDKPRIMIIVTSDVTSPPDPSEVVFDYRCTQTNPETGAVTRCSVSRSGESIELYMDVKPGSKKAPGEGKLDHENTINV